MVATTTPTTLPDSTSCVNHMYVHNMRALWRCDPELAIRIDAVADDARIAVESTRSGEFTARMTTSDGKSIYLHSRYDPKAEARSLIEGVEIDEKYCFVVRGFGLGYHIKALYERLRGDFIIVCCEPSIPLLAAAFSHVDIEEMISSGRLLFLTDGDKVRVHQVLQPHHTLMMIGAQFVDHAASMKIAPDVQSAITNSISEFVTFTHMSLTTLLANSRITCRNIAMNLVTYVSTPPIDVLKDRFVGDPCIIVSAGPSLSRNIDQIKALKGKAVIIAVQTSLKPLMQRGIVPDFVTSLDFHAMSKKFYENVGDLSDVHLVAEPKASEEVIDLYPGPISLLHNGWAELLIGEQLAARDGLSAGATVAHLAFYLANYLGCDPIIFVGQDLAFTGHVFYVPGVEIHQAWRSEINRFNSIEMKEWDRIARNGPILRKVNGLENATLYTDELLLTYLEQFEKDIAGVSSKVLNATEGGAAIRGAEPISLVEASQRFCEVPIDPQRFAYRESLNWHETRWLEPTRAELTARLSELKDVRSTCEQLLVLLKQLQGLLNQPDEFNRKLVRIDELRTKVSRASRGYMIVNAATQTAELQRYSADRRIGAVEHDDEKDRAKQQLVRDIRFMKEVAEGAKDMLEVLNLARVRIEEAQQRS